MDERKSERVPLLLWRNLLEDTHPFYEFHKGFYVIQSANNKYNLVAMAAVAIILLTRRHSYNKRLDGRNLVPELGLQTRTFTHVSDIC